MYILVFAWWCWERLSLVRTPGTTILSVSLVLRSINYLWLHSDTPRPDVTIPIMRIKNIFFPWQNWMRQWYLVCASARSNARRRVIHQSKALLLLFLVKWLSRLRDVCPVSKTNSSALYCEKYGENQLEIKFSRKYRVPRWQSAW